MIIVTLKRITAFFAISRVMESWTCCYDQHIRREGGLGLGVVGLGGPVTIIN